MIVIQGSQIYKIYVKGSLMFWLTLCVCASSLFFTHLSRHPFIWNKTRECHLQREAFWSFSPPLLSVIDLLVASFRSRAPCETPGPKAPLKITSEASCKELMSLSVAVTLIPGSPCQSVNRQWWNLASSGPVMFPINHTLRANSGFALHRCLHVSVGLRCLSSSLSVCQSVYIQVLCVCCNILQDW